MKSKTVIQIKNGQIKFGDIVITGDKMRVCTYEVVEELAFEAAQKNDVLSAGPSVVTGFAPTKRAADYFSKSLEDIFGEFTSTEISLVNEHFYSTSPIFAVRTDCGGKYDDPARLLDVLLQYFTFTEIRNNLRKLFA